MRSRFIFFCIFVAALVLTSGRAAASPIVFATAVASAQNADSNPFLIDSEESGVLIGADSTGTMNASVDLASASAFVLDGVLGASASATSFVQPGANNGTGAFGSVQFTDTLTLISDTLVLGTPVTLNFTLDLDSSVSDAVVSSGIEIACATASSGLFLSINDGFTPAGSLSSMNTSCQDPGLNNPSGTFAFVIGDQIRVDVTLIAGASARAGGSSWVDASHTLRFFADPMGDFSYLTASGNMYLSEQVPSPAPEPGTLSLLGLGAVGLLARRKRR